MKFRLKLKGKKGIINKIHRGADNRPEGDRPSSLSEVFDKMQADPQFRDGDRWPEIPRKEKK